MFLKRIEIYGFKSFAQKSVLDFEYNKAGNITAVVGPNGSGKSNVADAIRWVTGEQSSKNLRSKKSEDVIFCGSVNKSRSSYAEVSIILSDEKPFKFELNNKEHTLTEIEVSRKLYRSGESEYLINHRKVRLSDISQLLASLGFGQSSYTVIGQGMVDRLLFFSASERKILFDEAAGVKQYEIKREQAIRKLESTDNNLIRLRDILSELSPRVSNLRRLVKRAEGRKELEQEYNDIQNKYFGSLYCEYKHNSGEHDKQKNLLNTKIVQYDKEILALSEKSKEVVNNPFSQKRTDAEGAISALSAERDRLMQEVAYLKGQVESANRNISSTVNKRTSLEEEKESLKGKITFLQDKIMEEGDGLHGREKDLAMLRREIDELSGQIYAVEERLNKPIENNSDNVASLKSSLAGLLSKKAAAEVASIKLREAELDLSRNEARLSSLESLGKQLQSETDRAESEISSMQTLQSKADRELARFESELKKLSTAVSPESLSALDSEILKVENIKSKFLDMPDAGIKEGLKEFLSKLNKLFVQFRDISRAVNTTEREKIEKQIGEKRRALSDVTSEITKLQISQASKKSEISNNEKNIHETNVKIASLKSDMTNLKVEQLVVSDDEIFSLEEEIKKYEGTANERANTLLREKGALQEKITDVRNRYHELDLEYTRNKSVVENQKSEVSGAERRLVEIENSLQGLIAVPNDPGQQEIETNLRGKSKELDKLEEDLAKQRGGLTQIISAEREYEQGGIRLEREKRELSESKNLVQNELARLEVEIAKTTVRLEDLTEEIKAVGLSYNNETKYPHLDQMEKDVLRLKLENLRRKLDVTVGVDPETEAEYTELEKREIEMSTQVDDLTKAKADLEKVILELDARIKNQFSQVFSSISKEFTRYFSMLFGGGNADLRLGEGEDGGFGIEITANPPGKRVTSLNALSGGERTLTSLALLFAILSVNPSPFCILDEVDAALDESNTLRFIKILADLAHKTQFIIISHNRDTMKIANNLYGVTMNDEHVSKLLSIKLTEALVATEK